MAQNSQKKRATNRNRRPAFSITISEREMSIQKKFAYGNLFTF